jgi:hypothetical protein
MMTYFRPSFYSSRLVSELSLKLSFKIVLNLYREIV